MNKLLAECVGMSVIQTLMNSGGYGYEFELSNSI